MSHKIGVFDSGIGGFSILRTLIQFYPEGEFYYISDAPHAPYGPKEPQFIIERSNQLLSELVHAGCELVVVACNSATGVAIEYLRSQFQIPIIGVEPYINSKHHIDFANKSMVGLMTKVTANSTKFQKLKERVDPEGHIEIFVCPNLASLVEMAFARQCLTEDLMLQVQKELLPLKDRGFTHAILGCTHYSLIDSVIASYLGVKTLEPSSAVAKRMLSLLQLSERTARPMQDVRNVTFKFRLSTHGEWQNRELASTILLWPRE
ncbi:MAG: glutamate racemase [Bdellovibrio sp.]